MAYRTILKNLQHFGKICMWRATLCNFCGANLCAIPVSTTQVCTFGIFLEARELEQCSMENLSGCEIHVSTRIHCEDQTSFCLNQCDLLRAAAVILVTF